MLRRIVLVLCLFGGTVAYADGDSPHNFWLTYSLDQNESRSLDAILTLSLTPDDLLFLGAGQTDLVLYNQITAAYESAEVYNFSVQYSTLRTAPWSLELGYDFWGKNQELEIHTYNFGSAWHGDMWSLGLNLEQRKITIYTRYLELLGGIREAEIDSTGIGPVLDLIAGNWSWNLTGMHYDYNRDLSRFSQLRTLLRAYIVLGPRTFAHTTALAEWYATTVLKYRFTKMSLGGKYMHSVLATDQTETDSVSMLLDYKLSKRFTLDLELGQVYPPDSSSVNFGSVGLSFDF